MQNVIPTPVTLPSTKLQNNNNNNCCISIVSSETSTTTSSFINCIIPSPTSSHQQQQLELQNFAANVGADFLSLAASRSIGVAG